MLPPSGTVARLPGEFWASVAWRIYFTPQRKLFGEKSTDYQAYALSYLYHRTTQLQSAQPAQPPVIKPISPDKKRGSCKGASLIICLFLPLFGLPGRPARRIEQFDTFLCQFIAYFNYIFFKELRLINGNNSFIFPSLHDCI